MGRRDTLAELYDVDLGALVTFLKDRGFYVADASRSNYSQTYLSLASTLNMNYLDDVAAVMRNSRDRRPLDYLIQNNALMQAARKAGYQVVGISSDYLVTERWDGADICLCARYGLDELEQHVIWKTPLAALPLDRWTYGAHAPQSDQRRSSRSTRFLHMTLRCSSLLMSSSRIPLSFSVRMAARAGRHAEWDSISVTAIISGVRDGRTSADIAIRRSL